jgi:hypothetical protein
MWKRIGCALLGSAAGLLAGQSLRTIGVPPSITGVPMAMLGMVLALRYGERTGKIATVEDIHRPITLFGPNKQQ